jgi:uncharacterized protein YdhG (YjbR/CyaY superfamily)
MNKTFQSFDEYVNTFPAETKEILIKIRKIIKDLGNEIEESISYGMPAYKLKKQPIIYFAAYKKHIGIYATPSAHSHFDLQLNEYKKGKGSVQFPLDKEIPYDLIKEIILFKLKESK